MSKGEEAGGGRGRAKGEKLREHGAEPCASATADAAGKAGCQRRRKRGQEKDPERKNLHACSGEKSVSHGQQAVPIAGAVAEIAQATRLRNVRAGGTSCSI